MEKIQLACIDRLRLRNNLKGALDTTSQLLKLPKLRPDRVHIITSICFIEIGSGKPQVFLGLLSGGEKFYVKSLTVTTAEDSVNWDGEIIALEGDQIFAEAQSATAADEIVLTANGYSIKV